MILLVTIFITIFIPINLFSQFEQTHQNTPLKEALGKFIRKYDDKHKVEEYPFIFVQINESETYLKVYFTTEEMLLSRVLYGEERTFIDGGVIDGRKIIYCNQKKKQQKISNAQTCAQMVKNERPELYNKLRQLEKNCRKEAKQDEKYPWDDTISYRMIVFCDAQGNIQKIDYRDTYTLQDRIEELEHEEGWKVRIIENNEFGQ